MENNMTLNEYQDLAARTINKDLPAAATLAHSLHEIAAECGEIHSHFQKLYQGHGIDDNALMLEVGDLLWGIAEFCTASGWMLEDVAQANVEKLKKRYPDGFSADRSLNRDDPDIESMNPVDRQIFRTFCKR
jgi:NTP pyrophosphatase (non-canonical NTP hydrolase)